MPNQRIHSFGVENFKAFHSLQEVPLRPITLLFGKNNSGKSSLLRSLIHGRELFDSFPGNNAYHAHTQDDLPQSTADIGRYPAYLHDSDNPVTGLAYSLLRSLDFHLRSSAGPVSRVLVVNHYAFNEHIGDYAGEIVDPYHFRDREDLLSTNASISIDDDWLVRNGEWQLHSQVFYRLSTMAWHKVTSRTAEDDALKLMRLFFKHAALTTDIFSRSRPATDNAFPAQRLFEHGFRNHPNSDDASNDALPLSDIAQRITPSLSEEWGRTLSRTTLWELDNAVRVLIDHANELLGSVNAAAAQELGHQVYLGPLRTIPESEILQAHHTASGTALWEQLALDPRALDKVNEWLTRLTDREFGPQLVVEVEGDDLWLKKPQRNELRDALLLVAKQFLAMERRSTGTGEKRASALAAFQVEDLASRWADHICNSARQSLRIQLRVTTAGTQAPLPPSHVGLGISQIVPLLAAGAGTRDHLLLVEQPELHLHPAMQAELADFMIETALGSQCNTWVLESHSEHLLLRLMRRIRETTRGTLKEGAPALRPEDVSLCFVERESGVSRVYPIELDENGMLTRPWPGGFFEEGFREVMAW